MESFASIASALEVMSHVPPVIFRSSFEVMPLPLAEVTVRVPLLFTTISSFDQITASVLVEPSAT
jgi:hypothetical protein